MLITCPHLLVLVFECCTSAQTSAMQMLNTICKRVTQIQPRLTGGSECSSRTTADAFEIFRSTSSTNFANMSPKSHRGSGTGVSALGLLSPTAAGAAGGSGERSFHGVSSSGSANLSSAAAQQQQQLQYEIEAAAAAAAAGNGGAAAAAHARALQLAQLAEQKDLQGLEAALEAAPGPDQDDSDESSGGHDDASEFAAAAAAMQRSGSAGTPATSAAAANGSKQAAAGSNATSHTPPHLQAQSSLGAPPGVGTAAWHAWQQSGNLPPTPHTPVTPSRFSSKPGKLTVQDKDVLLVLTAFCKLASREAPGSSSSDSVLAQGKLLALEMLAKVTEQPQGVFCLCRAVEYYAQVLKLCLACTVVHPLVTCVPPSFPVRHSHLSSVQLYSTVHLT
jgi:hypothetical protein